MNMINSDSTSYSDAKEFSSYLSSFPIQVHQVSLFLLLFLPIEIRQLIASIPYVIASPASPYTQNKNVLTLHPLLKGRIYIVSGSHNCSGFL